MQRIGLTEDDEFWLPSSSVAMIVVLQEIDGIFPFANENSGFLYGPILYFDQPATQVVGTEVALRAVISDQELAPPLRIHRMQRPGGLVGH